MPSRVALFIAILFLPFWASAQSYSLDFYGSTFNYELDDSLDINFSDEPTARSIKSFYAKISLVNFAPLIGRLQAFRKQHELNDWLYYQLVRGVAQNVAPKQVNYARYTLYKWFLMCRSGYDARLATGNNQIIFFIKNKEDVADIPFFELKGNNYTCLNYHDYGSLFRHKGSYLPVALNVPGAVNPFSYKVSRLPEFTPADYVDKQLSFSYRQKTYHFSIKVNGQIGQLFKNYPVVDFGTYFNIPLSKETYQSLIPTLKENVKKMDTKQGVDYLMRFTRYAFLYEDDAVAYGAEKRFSPEQTLISAQSDCDDRAALFFYLVKEIYNLPMIALLYPTHITMAVAFDRPVGTPVYYNGQAYSICEPTPQKRALKIGQLANNLKTQVYKVVYAYNP